MATCTGYRRVVGVLVLAIGIVGMHALVVAPGHAMAVGSAMVMRHGDAAAPIAVDACDCGGHHGFHACVFVMTELIGMVGLLLLCWVVGRMDLRAPARIRDMLRRRQRAPPWTVLTLSELSLLRI